MGPREEEGLRRGRVGAGSGQERGSRPEGRDNCEREAVGHRSGGEEKSAKQRISSLFFALRNT